MITMAEFMLLLRQSRIVPAAAFDDSENYDQGQTIGAVEWLYARILDRIREAREIDDLTQSDNDC